MRERTSDTTFHVAYRIEWRLWLMRLLTLGGMGVSAYLTWAHLANQSVACGQSQDCDIVQQSVYSEVGGIPVALLGLLAYTALFVLSLLYGRLPQPLDDYIPLAIFGISLIGVLYSAYLTYLELFVIYAICRWCVTSAIIITAIFLLSLPGLMDGADSG
ncbi:MAG: hypothetical protein Kow0063_10570 [Anaerolineae bacterium]